MDKLEVLRPESTQIARTAAEQAEMEDHTGLLEEVVKEVSTATDANKRLDLSHLESTDLTQATVRRGLRALEAECVEVLRGRLAPSEFAQTVCVLREVFLHSVPKQPLTPACSELAHALAQDNLDETAPNMRMVVEFFRMVAAAMRDMVYAHDTQGNMFYLNAAGVRITKFSLEELAWGMSVYDFVAQEYIDLVEARLESPGAALRAPYSIEIYAKDGERVPIEINTRPLQGPEGEVIGVVGIARDLRLEHRLQMQIQRTNTHLQDIISNAPIGILTADTDGVVRDANAAAAQLCGAPRANTLIGLPLWSLDERDSAAIRQAVEKVVKDGEEFRERISSRSRFGSVINCDAVMTPLHYTGEAVEGVLVLLVDVTDLVTLERNLTQAEKMSALGHIIAGVAHEFNNPLTGILGYAQILLSTASDPKVRTRLEYIQEETQRCRRIVESLLRFSAKGKTDHMAVNINKLIQDILNLYDYQLRVDNIELQLEFSSNLPALQVAPQDLQRVFLNLLSNAHNALTDVEDRPRRLTIKTYLQNAKIHIVFEDNGSGIADDIRDKVFEPFFSTRPQGEGMGLGLSVSYGIVHDHDGLIELDSSEQGTTVTVILPAD